MGPMTESVVISGCGWVTPFAAGTIELVLGKALSLGRPADCENARWSIPDDLLAAYKEFPPELIRDRGTWLAAIALEHARSDARIDASKLEPQRVGLILGDALAGQLGMMSFATEVREQTPRFVSPLHFPQTVGNYTAGALARAYSIRGPNATIAKRGSSAGLDAVVEGCGLIARGEADLIFAGGLNCMSGELARGMADPHAHLADGACLFVLEPASRAETRGVDWLAAVDITRRLDTASDTTAEAPFLARALPDQPGAIVVAHWIGNCGGALGAACVAAAIGAGRGYEVPLQDGPSPENFVATTLCTSVTARERGAHVKTCVAADGDFGDESNVTLIIPC